MAKFVVCLTDDEYHEVVEIALITRQSLHEVVVKAFRAGIHKVGRLEKKQKVNKYEHLSKQRKNT